MSAASGIKVPPALSSAFAAATADAEDVRALVFIIEGDSFSHLTTVKPSGSYRDDINLLAPTLPTKQTPASFAYRLDSKAGGKYEWMMVTFVPDDAAVRAKMIQASSRSGLLKALGGTFKHDWFATNVNDLTPQAFKAHLDHILSPPPLSASEVALAEIREAEKEEAKRRAVDAELAAAAHKAVIGLGGKTKWDAQVTEALTKAAARSDDGWVEISAADTSAIKLLRSEACKPSEVASKLPDKSPCYVFYSYPTPPPPKPASKAEPEAAPGVPRNTFQASQGGVRYVQQGWAPPQAEGEDGNVEGAENGEKVAAGEDGEATDAAEGSGEEEAAAPVPSASTPPAPRSPSPELPSKGRVVFIYWCPTGSPVKYRMVYSTTVRSIQQDAQDKAGIMIAGKLETSDRSDITERALRDAVPAKPKHSTSLPTPTSAGRFGGGGGGAFGAPAPTRSFATPATAPVFGAPAPVGAAFGRPMPPRAKSASATPTGGASPSPTSPHAQTDDDEGDSKERIQNAFNAFGPRVGGSGGGGGFARPRPAGRR